jgi:hypothetical protein
MSNQFSDYHYGWRIKNKNLFLYQINFHNLQKHKKLITIKSLIIHQSQCDLSLWVTQVQESPRYSMAF